MDAALSVIEWEEEFATTLLLISEEGHAQDSRLRKVNITPALVSTCEKIMVFDILKDNININYQFLKHLAELTNIQGRWHAKTVSPVLHWLRKKHAPRDLTKHCPNGALTNWPYGTESNSSRITVASLVKIVRALKYVANHLLLTVFNRMTFW